MIKELKELFETEPEILFNKAQEIANGKKTIYCSPNIITHFCTTDPPCRHCKWENMKEFNANFYRKRTIEHIKKHTKALEEAGIDRMFFASGWMGYRLPDYFYDYVRAVREISSIETYGLFGAIDKESLANLKEAGLDGYLCGIESPNEEVYKKFRPGGDTLKDRINALKAAKEVGLKIWSGFLVGFGETEEDAAKGLEILKELDADSLSILPFTPFPHTRMMADNPANPMQWAKTMAVARNYMKRPDMFSDSAEGFYCFYGFLGGANGFYVFPGMNIIQNLLKERKGQDYSRMGEQK